MSKTEFEKLETSIVYFPIRFERVKRPAWIYGVCQSCNKKLEDIIWMAHSTPYIKWESDPAYGEFILCDPCGQCWKNMSKEEIEMLCPKCGSDNTGIYVTDSTGVVEKKLEKPMVHCNTCGYEWSMVK